jgi:hypothetical protein
VDDFPVRVPTPCDGPAATAPSPPSPRRADVHPPPSESGPPDPQTSARPCAQPESAGRGVAPQTKSEESNKPADETNKVEASDPSPSLVDKARSPAESPAEKPKSPPGDGESRRESHKSPVESPVESPPSRKRQSGANARPLDGLTEHASSSLATPPLKSRSSSPAFAEPVLPDRPAPKEEPSSQQSDPVAAPEGVLGPGMKGPGEEDSPLKAQSGDQERSAQMQRDQQAKKREVLDDEGGVEIRKVQRGETKAVSHEERSPEAVPRRQRPKRREDVSDERSKETNDEEAAARRREQKRARNGNQDEAGDKRDRRHREERTGRLESVKRRGREEGRDRRRGERGDVRVGREEDRRRSRASLRVGGDRKQTPGEERVERRERLKRAQEDSPGGGLARELRRLGGVKEEKAHNRGRSAGRVSGASPERGSDKRRPRWEEERGGGRKEVRVTPHGDERLPNKKRGRPPHKARNEEKAQGESDSGGGKSPRVDPNEADNGPASPSRGPAHMPPVGLAPPSPPPARPSSSHTAQSSPQPNAPPVYAAPPQPVVSASIATSPVPGEGGGLRAEAEEREPSGVGPLAAAESAAVGGGRGVRQDDHEEAASPHVPWPRRELPRKAVRREEEEEEETRGRGRGSVEREANGQRAPVQDGMWKPRRVPKWGGRRSRYWVPG